jgi:hypothetical protein
VPDLVDLGSFVKGWALTLFLLVIVALQKNGKFMELSRIHEANVKHAHEDHPLILYGLFCMGLDFFRLFPSFGLTTSLHGRCSWHGAFLNIFERMLIEANPKISSIPIWDWGADAKAIHQSPIWGPDYLGGSASDGQTRPECIPNGPFKSFQPEPGVCVRRGFSMRTGQSVGVALSTLPSAELTAEQLAKAQDFESARKYIMDVVHRALHRYVGGASQGNTPGGDMYVLLPLES